MAVRLGTVTRKIIGRACLGCAGVALVIPAVGYAAPSLFGTDLAAKDMALASPFSASSLKGYFTPATVDPNLARRVNNNMSRIGGTLRFTPAAVSKAATRTVTVAVRVGEHSLAIAQPGDARFAIPKANVAGLDAGLAVNRIAPTRYNLGLSRGFVNFAKDSNHEQKPLANTLGLINILKSQLNAKGAEDKPSRLQSKITLEKGESSNRITRSGGTDVNQSLELSGAYRISRNVDVTAGVRLSQERDRLAPQFDTVQDSQAIYVGTQFRF